MHWLNPPDLSFDALYARSSHQEGTGQWFFDSVFFQEWTAGSRKHIWLYGPLGCGKTVLSTAVYDYLVSKDLGIVLQFYFDSRDGRKQTVDQMIRGLVFQLRPSMADSPSTKPLDDLFQSHKKGSDMQQPTFKHLADCFSTILKASGNVFIVVDGLDECTEKMELLRWLANFLSNASLGHVKMLVTSREDREICRRVSLIARPSKKQWINPALMGKTHDKLDIMRLQSRLTHRPPMILPDGMLKEQAKHERGQWNCFPIPLDSVDSDIRSYVEVRLKYGEGFRRWNQTPNLLSQIHDEVGNGAGGMFRWAAYQLDSLEQCGDPSEVETVLASLPQDLHEEYNRILENIPDYYKESSFSLLQFILHSKLPLRLTEAVDVVGVRHGAFEHEYRLHSPEEILQFCPNFLSISNDENGRERELHLSHRSVQTFLSAKEKDFGEIDASISMTKTLLTYLASASECRYPENLSKFPLVRQAAFWMHYARQAEVSQDVVEAAADFLQNEKYFLSWKALVNNFVKEVPPVADERFRQHALYYACAYKLTRTARALISRGIHLLTPYGSMSAIQGCAYSGLCEIARLLLHKGVKAKVATDIRYSALVLASAHGHRDMVELLLETGIDVNADNVGRSTHGDGYGSALQAASSGGHKEIIQMLLNRAADVNTLGGKYSSVLQAASSQGHQEIVKMLLDKGADFNAQRIEYGSALQAASLIGHQEIVQMLLDRGADVNALGGEFNSSALQAASSQGHQEIVKMLLDKGADVNARDSRDSSALQAASSGGHQEIIQVLLDKGADVNALGGEFNSSALQAASLGGHQ